MVFSKFDSLSVRPPTPPKDLEDHVADADDTLEQFLADPFGERPALPKVIETTKALLNTPEQSPSSDISIPSSSASRQKRVNFELQTCAIPHKKAVAQSWTPTRSSPLRPLPQTRVSRPLKSILKPADETATPPPADDGAAAHKFKTFAEMLESIVKLLASAERPSRMDAYHSLQRTMQAYDKIPDDQALKKKMGLLTQFIRRDIQAPSPTGTGLDSQLVGQALKLLMALFRITEAAAAMEDDFCTFIIERSIQVASDSAMPKIVVNTHLAALMQQNFRPKIMTVARVEKILDVLDTIHDRVNGFSVQAYRIRIYRKLIQQRPDIMIKHTERWFKLSLRAFVAGQKDINQSALDIALSAAKTIGHDRHVAKSCLAVLNRVRSDGNPIAKVFTKELERMLGGDNACMVPQIWAAITVLLRDSMDGSMFSSLKEWLEVFQKCIASTKAAVRVQTNVAFCFLLYSVNLSPDTSEAWTMMFLKIPLHQLQRRVPDDLNNEERNAITSGYVTLLYYSLRPTASYEQLDRYWREFVASFWTQLLRTPGRSGHTIAACRIVSALFNGSRKPWNEQRALDQRPQCMVKRGELPLLDPKWIRRSLSLVLQFVELLLEATPWSENERQEDEPVKTMWLTLLDSLVEASSKEVMASSETKDAMAHIVNLLRRLWDSHTAQLALSQQNEDTWANKFCFLVETVVQKLGAFHFADKFLTRNGSDEFEVASTPSRSRQNSTRISPLLYFVDLLVNQSEGKLPDAVRLRALKLILEPCFNAQSTRFGQLEFLRDCSSAVNISVGSTVVLNFWAHVATFLQFALQKQNSDTSEQGSRPLGKEYNVVVELLSSGSTYLLCQPKGHDVLSLFINTVRTEAGESAVVLAVIEKVSERVLEVVACEEPTSCLPYITALLQNMPKQTNRRSLEQARQVLWPLSPAVGRHADFDPYNHLYGAIISVGHGSYANLTIHNAEAIGDFLAALGTSIKDCTTSHLAVYLRKTQDVIRKWVEDAGGKLQSSEQPMKALHLQVVNLWTEATRAIERLPRKDSQILMHLEPLITAGFVSRRRGMVNISIATWNKTFGQEESLRYPSRLEHALRRLRSAVELSLPSLEPREEDATDILSFYESENDMEDVRPAFKSPRVKESPFKIAKSTRRSLSRSPAVATPNRRSSARQIAKVRLRHDNSQIQFEPIISSPTNPFNQESQVLTERQKEMLERQKLSGGLFANMGAPSPQPDVSSPMELHSDIVTADDVQATNSRMTPLKTIAAMGPMDAFLGSSPTPHARRSTRQIFSDETNLATPSAVRTVKVANIDELGSSPPRFERTDARPANSDVLVGSNFDYRQPDSTYDGSFDDGTTIDEDALLEAVARQDEADERAGTDTPSDVVMSDMPSSTVDLQLTAQLDADIQALTAAAEEDTSKPTPESNNEFVAATSHPQSANMHDGSDTEVDESQPDTPVAAPQREGVRTRASDSASKPSSAKKTPQSQSVRRSFRHSATPSPLLALGPKLRKPPPTKVATPKRQASTEKSQDEQPSPAPPSKGPSPQPDADGMLDNIVVLSPTKRDSFKPEPPTKKRKSSTDSHVMVPETHRKRGPVRRSQSLLSQVENSQDVLVSDTPTPKRVRQTSSQDVSEAKSSIAAQAQAKRLSHVQVTPKKSPEASRPTSSHRQISASQPITATGTSTPSRSFTERVILTPRSIINQLKSLKDYLWSAPAAQLVLGREEEREIDDALFDIRRRVHAAGARGEEKIEE